MGLENRFKPSYQTAQGTANLGFILSCFLSENFRNTERKIIYIFHFAGIINLRLIDRRMVTKQFLLQRIFDLTFDKKFVKKKELYDLTGLSKDTFNKYFEKLLLEHQLQKRRAFTLSETFHILKFWQGDDKWGRMEAYTKKELAAHFTGGNYEILEIEMTTMISPEIYRNRNKIAPKDAKAMGHTLYANFPEKLELFYEEKFESDYLTIFFYLFLAYSF